MNKRNREFEENEWQSKSAKKRMSAARQKIGEELLGLAPELRKRLTLPTDLHEALLEHDRITDKEAARRQRQYIGRLMREIDLDELMAALDARMANGEFATPPAQKAYRELRRILSGMGQE